MLALYEDLGPVDAEPGRVVRVARSSCFVVSATGECLASGPVQPAVGDWVRVRDGVVVAVAPRWSALSRLDPDGTSVQVMAANVDVVLITAPADRLSPARVERELVLAWDSGARPVVVLTKSDLGGSSAEAELRRRLPGVEVLMTSAATESGIEELRAVLHPQRTAVLMGPSGAGKSSLANRLLGDDVLPTGVVRKADRRGRHTTTSRQLVCVPGGGVLIDTPGLRSLSLAGDGEGMERVFADIDDLAGGCRFTDCRHDSEPGCAVRAAVASGRLDPARLASHDKLREELVDHARRSDAMARTAEQAAGKASAERARARSRRRRR